MTYNGLMFEHEPNGGYVTSKEYALLAAAAADEKKGSDIIIQEVSDLLVVTDYFVLVTASNKPQIEAIIDAVKEKLRLEAGIKPISVEGDDVCEWVLLDYGDIVVHIFRPDIREFYRLETLWGDAPIVDLSEAGIEEPSISQKD